MPLLLPLLIALETAPADPGAALIGSWDCAGHFASGKPIASRLTFTHDEATGALLLHHDDVPPTTYHAIETWSMPPAGPMRAAIADRSGMRWFASTGWAGGTLTWSRPEDAAPIEQFAYTLSTDGLKVIWSIARNGGTPVMGDTIDCHRHG